MTVSQNNPITREVTEHIFFSARRRDFSDYPDRGYVPAIVTKRQTWDGLRNRWMTDCIPVKIELVK